VSKFKERSGLMVKISKAVLAGFIALSIMSLTACGAKVDVTKDESNSQQSAVVSNGNASSDSSNNSSEKSSDTAGNTASGEETKKDAKGESKTEKQSANSESTGSNGEANAYGYYEETNPPASGVSVAALAGTWRDMGIGTEILTITSGDDLYKGNFSFRFLIQK